MVWHYERISFLKKVLKFIILDKGRERQGQRCCQRRGFNQERSCPSISGQEVARICTKLYGDPGKGYTLLLRADATPENSPKSQTDFSSTRCNRFNRK